MRLAQTPIRFGLGIGHAVLTPQIAQEIADTITEAIGHNVLVTDHEGRVIGSGDPSRLGELHEASLDVVRRRAVASHDSSAASRLSGVRAGMTLPLMLGHDVLGTVGITGEPDTIRPFGEIVRRQTEIMLRHTMLLRLDLLRERALEQLIGDVASFDGTVDAALLEIRAEELGFRLDVPRTAVVFRISHPARSGQDAEPGTAADIDHQARMLHVSRLLRQVFDAPHDVVTSVGADTVALLADRTGPRGADDLASACGRAVEEVARRYFAEADVGIGSDADGLAELSRSYHEAWSALRLGRRLAPDRRVHHAHAFRLQELLVGASPSHRERYREALLARLAAERSWPALRATIMAWLEHGFRLVDTARALHIHRNTLLYRLERISGVIGDDIRSPGTALSLYLACLLEELDDDVRPPFGAER